MSSTQQLARRYCDAWTSGDSRTVARLPSADLRFAAGDRARAEGGDHP